MTIKQITIKNFQSHKKTMLNLHPGVNAIIGSSDCGKSAILRSLGWLIRNRSEDRAFRSSWGGKTDVEVKFADGKEISRVQDKDNAYYLLDPINKVDEEYKAFRTDIPEDIVSALNMDSINIQSQFDPPFLLSDSSGDVAKLLNKIANLTDIDTSISNIRKQVLGNSREISRIETLIADLTNQNTSFDYLTQMEVDVESYYKLCDLLSGVDTVIGNLSASVAIHSQKKSELNEIESFLKAEHEVEAASTLIEELKLVTGQIRVAETLLNNAVRFDSELNEIKSFLTAEPLVLSTIDIVSELNDIQKEGQALTDLLKVISRQDKECSDLLELEMSKDKEFFDNFPDGPCPLCGRVYE